MNPPRKQMSQVILQTLSSVCLISHQNYNYHKCVAVFIIHVQLNLSYMTFQGNIEIGSQKTGGH